MQRKTISINILEKDVIDKLLEKKTKINRLLREQFTKALVVNRWFSGSGFFTSFQIADDSPIIESQRSFQIDGLDGKVNNIDVGFILFIEKGKLKTLEGFTYYGEWPEKIMNYELFYEKYN